jgi:hypothetical protein
LNLADKDVEDESNQHLGNASDAATQETITIDLAITHIPKKHVNFREFSFADTFPFFYMSLGLVVFVDKFELVYVLFKCFVT